MFTDRRIKAYIKSITKPKTSFADFCKAHGIDLNTPQVKRGVDKRKFVFPSAIAAVLTVSVCLAVFLPVSGSVTPEARKYLEDDVKSIPVTVEQFASTKDLFLFDTDRAEDIGQIYNIVDKEKENVLLAGLMTNIVYGGVVDDKLYAYQFEYRVRYYDNYFFDGIEVYLNLSNSVEYYGIRFNYEVKAIAVEPMAYIAFEKGAYDYYMTINSFNNMTEMNDQNIETFIGLLFGAAPDGSAA